MPFLNLFSLLSTYLHLSQSSPMKTPGNIQPPTCTCSFGSILFLETGLFAPLVLLCSGLLAAVLLGLPSQGISCPSSFGPHVFTCFVYSHVVVGHILRNFLRKGAREIKILRQRNNLHKCPRPCPGACGIYDLTGQKRPCSCVKDLEIFLNDLCGPRLTTGRPQGQIQSDLKRLCCWL